MRGGRARQAERGVSAACPGQRRRMEKCPRGGGEPSAGAALVASRACGVTPAPTWRLSPEGFKLHPHNIVMFYSRWRVKRI